MKYAWLAALMIGILPAMTLADHRDRGHSDRGDHWDRGDRYRGSDHSRSHNFFDFSIGFGSRNWYDGGSYSSFSYRNYDRPIYRERYYAPVYSPPVVVYREPAYCPPPVVVYPAPSYYYDTCPAPSTYYYSQTRYYYGR